LIKLKCKRIILSHLEDSTIEDALTTLADLLSKKDYAQAESFWLKQQATQSDHAYWHNLGAIYKLKGELSLARYAFEKANYATVFSFSTHQELSEVKNLLKVDSQSHDPLHPAEWAVSLGPYKLWGLSFFIGFVFLLFLKREMSRLAKSGLILASLLPVALMYLFLSSTRAFVVTKPLPVYGGASQLFAKGQFIPEGELLIGIPKSDWTMIRSSAGDELWVKNSELQSYAKFLWE